MVHPNTAAAVAQSNKTRPRNTKPPRTNAQTRKSPRIGRPPTYTTEQRIKWQDEICAWIMNGKALASFCAIPGNPTANTIAQWRRESEAFAHDYTRAREDGADAWADEIVSIADAVKNCRDSAMVNAARLRVDARKWAASKLKPRIYGDRIEAAFADPDGKPLGTALMKYDDLHRARVLAALQTFRTIEGATSLQQLLEGQTIEAEAEPEKVNLSPKSE